MTGPTPGKAGTTRAIIDRFHRGVGVFLDPPYVEEKRLTGLYAEDKSLNEAVTEWALVQPKHVRTVIAGYADEYPALVEAGWRLVYWKAPNGYAQEGNQQRHQEVLYLSPARRLVRRSS